MSVSLSTLTTLAVYLYVVSDDIPRTSQQTPLFAIYINILLAMASASVVMSALVIRIYDRSPQDPIGPGAVFFVRKLHPRMRKISNRVKRQNQQRRSPVHVLPTTLDVVEEEPVITWPMVAETVDLVLFVSSVFIVVLMTCCVFSIMLFVE